MATKVQDLNKIIKEESKKLAKQKLDFSRIQDKIDISELIIANTKLEIKLLK